MCACARETVWARECVRERVSACARETVWAREYVRERDCVGERVCARKRLRVG